jgi:LacI family transcriptional regulator
VASRAGVSPATVSSALTGVRPVAAKSRQLVFEAVDALGFKVNHLASSLRRGATKTVGLVVPDLSTAFYASLVREFENHAANSGYEILLASSSDSPIKEAVRIESLISRRVDGLLVIATQDDFGVAPGFPDQLPPTVLIDAAFGHPSLDTVASDNLGAGRSGCEYLLQLGHRDIALLTPDLDLENVRDRITGYRQALSDAGLAGRERVIVGGRGIETCRGAIEQELRRPDPPTAMFAITYFATLGAIKAIQAMEMSFPDDVSLVGFAHAEWMTAIRPYITAVSQAYDTLAANAWHVLEQRMNGSDTELARIRLPFRMNIRESARQRLPVQTPRA